MKKKAVIKISIALNLIFICAFIFQVNNKHSVIDSEGFTAKLPAIIEQTIEVTDAFLFDFYNASEFKIIGKLPNTDTYKRLPLSALNDVNESVWSISENSAGISIRFSANTSSIRLRWKLINNRSTSNMTPIAYKGLDLYAFTDGKWQFVGAAKPTEIINNRAIVIDGMDTINREYLLNLPLYDGIRSLEIGVDKGALISKPSEKIIDVNHPIVFYGTSITQGSSASRSGLTYPALIERYFNKEVINLGFSGYGKFEKEIAKYIMTANPSLIILDCTPNSPADTILKNLPETIDYISAFNDSVPILLIESFVREYAYFKKEGKSIIGNLDYINKQNKALKQVFDNKSKTRKNLYYIRCEDLIGKDHEATIDGTHFNDLGHYRAFKYLRGEIEKIIKP